MVGHPPSWLQRTSRQGMRGGEGYRAAIYLSSDGAGHSALVGVLETGSLEAKAAAAATLSRPEAMGWGVGGGGMPAQDSRTVFFTLTPVLP